MSQPDPTPTAALPATPTARFVWFPLVLAVLAILALAGVYTAYKLDAFSPANTFLASFSTLAGAAILFFLWFVWFGPGPAQIRNRAFRVVLVSLATLVASVQIVGVNGDIVPILACRWSKRPDERLARPQPVPATTTVDLRHTTPHDFPQFLGPGRNATLDDVHLADWSPPLRPLWKQEIGAGWSAFAVVGPYAVTQEQRGTEELVTCYEVATGKLLWSHATTVRFEEVLAGVGPRATPTIDEGRVYALGSLGHLTCLDGATGNPIWQHNIVAENNGVQPTWGKSNSPLVHGELVITSAGGPRGHSLIAYDKLTGTLRWHAGDSPSSYASPMLATLGGVEQILMVNVNDITAHDPADGQVLWQHQWSGYDPGSPNCSQPIVVSEDRVLLSKGYGIGSTLIQIKRDGEQWTTKEIWKDTVLKTKFTNAVVRDGFAYGLDEGVLECIALDSGKKRWKQGKYGHGQILLAADRIVVQSEAGDLALVDADPKKFHERFRFTALSGTCWNTMALTGNRLLVRSNEEAACFELPLATPTDQ